MNQRIRVLIAEDWKSAGDGLKLLLAFCPEFEVVGLASDGWEAVVMAGEFLPDVILMDIQLPLLDGLQASQMVKRKWPQIKVIALTMYAGYKAAAFSAGVDAYLLKGFDFETLYETILSTQMDSSEHLLISGAAGA